MKSYTNIEQSKKLAKILPLESADMGYLWNGTSFCEYPVSSQTIFKKVENIPCWSLSALLDIIPEGLIENYYAPNLQKENGKYSIAYGNEELLCIADNSVDACYEMILKLHELNLL